MDNHYLLKLLSSSNYLTYNLDIAKLTSPNAAILYGYICSQINYFNTTEIFANLEKIKNYTGLGFAEIKTATEILKKHKLINVVKKGLPATNHYSININNLVLLLQQVEGNSFDQSSENQRTGATEINAHNTNKSNTNRNTNNNNNSKFDFSFVNDIIISKFLEYINLRTKLHKSIKTQNRINKLYKDLLELSNNDLRIANDILQQSIDYEYLDVYPIKNKKQNYASNQQHFTSNQNRTSKREELTINEFLNDTGASINDNYGDVPF